MTLRKVVIVNDCAHVMEDIIPYLQGDFNIRFIRRSRGLWSKTCGILWKILRSHGDIFHVSYALQDAYLVDKLKHLDMLTCHGSDVRWTIRSKKYGWIVRHNLKNAKKVVYATPDLEPMIAKFRVDASYLPTPVVVERFTEKQEYSDKPKAVYFKQSYEHVASGLLEISKRIPLAIQDRNIPYEDMPNFLKCYDVFVDRFTIPSLSKTCLEAMSCGLATIDYRHHRDLGKRIDDLSDIKNVKRFGHENRLFVEKNHDVKQVAVMLSEMYEEMMESD